MYFCVGKIYFDLDILVPRSQGMALQYITFTYCYQAQETFPGSEGHFTIESWFPFTLTS